MVYKNKQVFQDYKNLHTIGNTRLWVGITCINHILYISFCSHESLTITDIDVNRFFKPPSHASKNTLTRGRAPCVLYLIKNILSVPFPVKCNTCFLFGNCLIKILDVAFFFTRICLVVAIDLGAELISSRERADLPKHSVSL